MLPASSLARFRAITLLGARSCHGTDLWRAISDLERVLSIILESHCSILYHIVSSGRIRFAFGHSAPRHIAVMFRILCFLPFSTSAIASSLNDRDQTLPAINVKYDFSSSSTIAFAKEKLDIVNRDAVFSKRVQNVELKTQEMSHALQEMSHAPNG